MKKNKKAFTLIELVFIIVIIGILSAVALPKLTATRDDALIAKSVSTLKVLLMDLDTFYMAQGKKGFNLAKWRDITDSVDYTEADQLVVDSQISINSESNQPCFNVAVSKDASNQIIINIIASTTAGYICNQSKNIAMRKGLLNASHEREFKLGQRASF